MNFDSFFQGTSSLKPSTPKKDKIICEYDDCAKIFKSKKTLRDHLKIHKGEKPYSCTFLLCDKAFTQYSSFQKHQRIHSGEKPYVCQLCGQAFTQASNLKRHERVHNGEKPHTCEICLKEFVTSSNLKQHSQTHVENDNRSKYKCDDCGKAYNYNSSLKKHLKVHQNTDNAEFPRSDQKYETPYQDPNNFEKFSDYYNPYPSNVLDLNVIPEDYQVENNNFFDQETDKIEEQGQFEYKDYYLDQNVIEEREAVFESEITNDFQIYHDGHFHILEDCKLKHVDKNGALEEHKLTKSEENPVRCKPLKEITHISRLAEFLSNHEKLINEKQLTLNLDTIINSCNILTCSKIKPEKDQTEPLTVNDPSMSLIHNGLTNEMICECLAMLNSKRLESGFKGHKDKYDNLTEKNQTKVEDCLCQETLFLKHIHSENCGHPKIYHDDHYDYIVDGHLHHVHGNHCDDHGKVLVVE